MKLAEQLLVPHPAKPVPKIKYVAVVVVRRELAQLI